MPVDANLYVRDGGSAGNLTATETVPAAGLNVGESPLDGFTLEVRAPQATGTTPTLAVKVQSSATSGGTYVDVAVHPANNITAAGVYKMNFKTPPKQGWIKVVNTVGGTTPNFGAVDEYISNKEFPKITKA